MPTATSKTCPRRKPLSTFVTPLKPSCTRGRVLTYLTPSCTRGRVPQNPRSSDAKPALANVYIAL